MASTAAYQREMAVTHRDFFRILPRAIGDHEYAIADNCVTIQVGSGNVQISIGPEQVRKIALIRIPYCVVAFQYENVGEQQQTDFQEHFDLYYRRGGG